MAPKKILVSRPRAHQFLAAQFFILLKLVHRTHEFLVLTTISALKQSRKRFYVMMDANFVQKLYSELV